MIVFTILMMGLVIFEIKNLWGKDNRKEMMVFIGLALITLAFGYYYISNPYRDSLAKKALKIYDSIFGKIGG